MKSSSLALAAFLMLTCACDDDKPTKPGTPANATPVAVTNGDQTVSEGAAVTLDGANSSDADDNIVQFAWAQTAGPEITLSGASAPVATFTAPDVSDTTIFRFTLTITDATDLSATAAVVITVVDLNAAPVVDAGADQSVDALEVVTLNGSATDDGTVTSYQWTQVSGPDAGDITNADQATATITAPDVDQLRNLVFELAVTDDESKIGSSTVTVNVTPVVAGIAFVEQPTVPPQRNEIWSDVAVDILNATGDRIIGGDAANLDIDITAALEDTTDVTANLNGTLTIAASSGTATFRDFSYPVVTEDNNAIILTASAVGVTPVDSQPIAVDWLSELPGGLTSTGSIVPTLTTFLGGDLLIAGTFSGTVDFDFAGGGAVETVRTSTTDDVFLARYTRAGTLTWVQTITSSQPVDFDGLAIAGDAMLVAVGYGGGATVTFPHDTTPVDVPATGGDDVAFAEISTDGITQWAGAIAGAGDEYAHAVGHVVRDLNDYWIIAGEFSGANTDFDPDASATAESSTSGNAEGFVLKLDTDGGYVWHMPVAGPSGPGDAVRAIGFQGSSTDVMAAGNFGSDAFIVRLDTDDGLEKVNVTIAGATGSDTAVIMALEEGNSNSLFVIGEFDGTVDFDPDAVATAELTTDNGPEVFVARYNTAGVFSWVHRVTSGTSLDAIGIALRSSELVIAGTARGIVDFDPDGDGALFDLGAFEAPYVATFSLGAGTFGWHKAWENTIDLPLTAFSSVGSRMLLGGLLSGTADLDPDETVVDYTGTGAWFVKVDQEASIVP